MSASTSANIRRTIRGFRTQYELELKAMGIDPEMLTPKAFRKTAATVVKEELSLESAQGLLGHSNSMLTDTFYVHTTKLVDPSTAEALARRFSSL